uniref:Uncharacterized protein isoform X3 n=1 Tax=Nicotiana tabacum TaxID=4097 RepID=A0A1S3Z630_TOBAC|nr:PREDICTED: uncharacterized protein LOC107783213 isoform X3 [Nicotiana tabacum]
MAKHPLYVKLYLFHNPNSSHCFSLFHSPAILLCNSGGAGADHVPVKTLLIDGNCRVEDRGLKTHHGHMVYVLSIYNKREKYNRMTIYPFFFFMHAQKNYIAILGVFLMGLNSFFCSCFIASQLIHILQFLVRTCAHLD